VQCAALRCTLAIVFDPFDSEGIANYLYRLGNVDPQLPIGAEALARSIPEIVAVRDDATRMMGYSAHTWSPQGRTIWLRRRATPAERNFDCAHELVEFALEREHSPFIELACDQGAGAVVAPRPAYRRMLGALGEDFARLAEAFVISESCAALRFGEVTETPLVLVAPGVVRVRGAEWSWPPESELRRLARARAVPPELRRLRLGDDPRRVVLVAA
jgi:hypothetical protein